MRWLSPLGTRLALPQGLTHVAPEFQDGLLFLYSAAADRTVGGRLGAVSGVGYQRVATPLGPAMSAQGGSSFVTIPGTAAGFASPVVTIVVVGRQRNTGGINALISKGTGSNGFEICLCNQFGSPSNRIYASYRNSGGSNVGFSGYVNGGPLVSLNGAVDTAAGPLYTIVAQATDMTQDAVQDIALGGLSGYSPAVDVLLAGVWVGRSFAPTTQRLIASNAARLFLPERRIWAISAPAGGADTSISASPVGRASATAQLSTAIRLSASAQGTGTASMVLSTQLRLSASPTATATAASTLTTQVRLAATPTGTGTASTALVTQIRLAANATGTGLASFSLASGSAGELAFSATGRASASAALLTGISLQASATGNGGAIAQLSTAVQLQASPTAVGTATATLATQIRLAASPTGAGMATMALSTSAANELAFTATGRASASTSLSTQLLLVTSPTARAQAVAQLSTAIRISASPIARGSATAQLETGLAVLLVPARIRRAVPAVTLRRAVPTVHLRRAVPAP